MTVIQFFIWATMIRLNGSQPNGIGAASGMKDGSSFICVQTTLAASPSRSTRPRRRADIEDRQHFTIIANNGDQLSDLVGGYAQKCFQVPNPFYFIPGEPVPPSGLACLSRRVGNGGKGKCELVHILLVSTRLF